MCHTFFHCQLWDKVASRWLVFQPSLLFTVSAYTLQILHKMKWLQWELMLTLQNTHSKLPELIVFHRCIILAVTMSFWIRNTKDWITKQPNHKKFQCSLIDCMTVLIQFLNLSVQGGKANKQIKICFYFMQGQSWAISHKGVIDKMLLYLSKLQI